MGERYRQLFNGFVNQSNGRVENQLTRLYRRIGELILHGRRQIFDDMSGRYSKDGKKLCCLLS